MAGSSGRSWRTGQFIASEAALLQERAIIGRLSREELEDRSVYSLRGCHTTGESNHWQALQGRAGGQDSIQPPRLPFYRSKLSLAGSTGKSWRTGQYTATEDDILSKRDILGRLSIEELYDKFVYFTNGGHKIQVESHLGRGQRYTEISHDPLLFGVAHGIF